MCHYILVCTHFVNYRKLIFVWYYENSNVIRFNELMRINNVEKLKELPKFLKKTFKNVKTFKIDYLSIKFTVELLNIAAYYLYLRLRSANSSELLKNYRDCIFTIFQGTVDRWVRLSLWRHEKAHTELTLTLI